MTMPPTYVGRSCPSPAFVMQHLHSLREGQIPFVGMHLVKCTFHGAFGAGAVVAADVDDERVTQLAHVLYRLDDAANLIVSVSSIAGKVFRLSGVELFLHQRERVPSRQLRAGILGLTVRPGSKLGSLRDHAEPF